MPWTKLPRSLWAQCHLPTSFHFSGPDKSYPLGQRVSEDGASPGERLWIAAVCGSFRLGWDTCITASAHAGASIPQAKPLQGLFQSCSNIKTCPGTSVFLTAWFRRISQKQFSIQWVIYITYYRFLWSQLGNLPGHCSLFPTTSTLHKEESFQANSVPLAALFPRHHPSSLSISWPATKYFSLSQILTVQHFLFTFHFAKSAARECWASWKAHTWNSSKPNLSHTLVVCANASAVETH